MTHHDVHYDAHHSTRKAQQIVLVTTPSWESHQGQLYQFERSSSSGEWILQKSPIPVVIGKNGMAWGIGLHTNPSGPIKKEGDGKSPAGIFTLGPVFGRNSLPTKMDFLRLHGGIEAVDDPSSRYYNQIVNRQNVASIDWTSSEKMEEISLYEIGLVIQHNWKEPISGAGSAIFMHLWKDSSSGTAGCTAMSYQNLYELLTWLDPEKKPILIQLPSDLLNEKWKI